MLWKGCLLIRAELVSFSPSGLSRNSHVDQWRNIPSIPSHTHTQFISEQMEKPLREKIISSQCPLWFWDNSVNFSGVKYYHSLTRRMRWFTVQPNTLKQQMDLKQRERDRGYIYIEREMNMILRSIKICESETCLFQWFLKSVLQLWCNRSCDRSFILYCDMHFNKKCKSSAYVTRERK